MFKTIKPFIKHPTTLAAIISLVCALPTLPFYYFGEPLMYQSHDHVFHAVRLWYMQDALSHGIVMPSWLTGFTFGLGSPVFLFSWFLPYYFALPFRYLGASLIDSIKALFLLSYFLSGLTIYFLAKKLTNHAAALVSIAFYLLSPFRLNLIFTRGGPGEAFAQVLIPLALFFAISKSSHRSVFLTLVLVSLSLTHNISFIFTLGLLIFWAVFFARDKSSRLNIISSIVLSLLLTAFFWLPALLEREFTHYHQTARDWYQTQFVSFRALIDSPWQYGPPMPDQQNLSMSFQLGKIHWLIILLLPIIFIKAKKLSSQARAAFYFFSLSLILSIFFQIKASKFIWDHVDAIQIFIFPWRLQAISILCLSILASLLFSLVPKRLFSPLFALVLILLLLANRHHFPTSRGDYAADDYLKNFGNSGGSQGEFLPIWADVEEYHQIRDNKIPPPSDIIQPLPTVNLISKHITPTSINLVLNILEPSRVVLNHYYFPGWRAVANGNKLTIDQSLDETKGRMNFYLPRGQYQISLAYRPTPIRTLANLISLTTLSGLVGYYVSKGFIQKS